MFDDTFVPSLTRVMNAIVTEEQRPSSTIRNSTFNLGFRGVFKVDDSDNFSVVNTSLT